MIANLFFFFGSKNDSIWYESHWYLKITKMIHKAPLKNYLNHLKFGV